MTSRLLLLLGVGATVATSLPAQNVGPADVRSEVFAGSELEDYLRVLQLVGTVPPHPWSVRALGPRDVDRLAPRDTVHPWARRYAWRSAESGWTVHAVGPSAGVWLNSTFPYGSNDGAVWAGRGLTVAVQGGVAVRRGAVSVTLAPLAFRAENLGFALQPNGQTGALAFADGRFPLNIDRPQRFGVEPYSALDPGQSAVRVDAAGVAFGLATAQHWWGPTVEYPVVLGNNAAGFPHGFLGTATPVDLWIVRAHGRLVWGELAQSRYSSVSGPARRRFAAGIVVVLTPRGVPGLEIGVSRFSHSPWPAGGLALADLTRPLRSQFRQNVAGIEDNQLASAFARWVFPASGLELWGEYGREDYNLSFRDFVLEPDHIGGYTLGFRKLIRRSAMDLWLVRAEVQSLQISQLTLARAQTPFYVHGSVPQGHTHRGQVLGSAAGVGGAASMLALERYHAGGRWTAFVSRELRQDRGAYLETGSIDPRGLDVQVAAGGNALFFEGRYDVTAGATMVYELNRDLRSRDAWNLQLTLGARAAWW